MIVCDCCNKSELEQGSVLDCEVWNNEGKDLLLCDDCFFNESYKNNEQEKTEKEEINVISRT